MPKNEKVGFQFYFAALTRMLTGPRAFFRELPLDSGWKNAIFFLTVSSLFFTAASLTTCGYQDSLFTGTVCFVNAMGMVLILSGVGYMVMVMSMGRKTTFRGLFSIYAFSSGVVLLAAWVPFFIFITEPCRWILIGTGLTKGAGFKWYQALWVIGVSIGIIVLFFKSLLLFIGWAGV